MPAKPEQIKLKRKRTRKIAASVAAAVTAIAAAAGQFGTVGAGKYAGCWFDEVAADRVCNFVEWFCRHSKGEWAGQTITLEPWQRDILREAFGWKRADGTRKYRTIFVFLPRKNGKSTLAAAVSLYLTCADDEPGAEVYVAATNRQQADAVFEEARRMVNASPDLADRLGVYRNAVVFPETLGSLKALSGRPTGKHSFNPHGLVGDELHEWRGRELYEALTTAQGSRRQPMTWWITTAGYDRESVCFELYDYARKVRDGIVEDPTFLPVIFEAGKDDDWTDERVWAKANPNLGVSVKLEFLREQCEKAKATPAAENAFRRYHLNQWTQQVSRAIPMAAWDACAGPVDAGAMAGRECWAALDLSSTTDIAAFVAVFPNEAGALDVLCRFWMPRDTAARRAREDMTDYETWIRQGLITATDGDVIDYDWIRNDVRTFAEAHRLREIAYDPWNATQLVIKLSEEDGLPMVKHPQGFASMNAPSKAFETLVLGGKLRHGGHPVLRWMCDNLSWKTDPSGNIKPVKTHARLRIDGIVALIMACGRASIATEAPEPSIFFI